MLQPHALKYGFHTFLNLLKNPLERMMWLCLYTNALPLTSRGISERDPKVKVSFVLRKKGRDLDLGVSLRELYLIPRIFRF